MSESDRDRVLMNIAVDTAGTVHDSFERVAGGWRLRFTFDRPSAQFIPEKLAQALKMPLQPGDIVRCKTNPNHRWGISEFVERLGYAEFLLREIGGDRLLKMGNESVDVLRFMSPSRLYTGAKHRVYRWVTEKAFSERYNPDADYFKRCGGVEFDGDTLVIWSRPHIWVMERVVDGQTQYAQPRRIILEWSSKTRLKDIVDAMKEQGFAEDFEFSPERPLEGMAGFATATKDSLASVLSKEADHE